jgi:hypothetical protein
MIPGQMSRLTESVVASAATITVLTDIVRVTGAVAVTTITPAAAGASTIIFVITTDGAVVFNVGGNIAKAATSIQFQVLSFVFDSVTGLWYPGAL